MDINNQLKIILKGVHEVINANEFEKKLINAQRESRPLIAKLGLDPTAPDIHLGHSVVLRKMKQIQDLGHKVIIIIGDFTGMIGDPTGKSKTRKQLTQEEVFENAKTYEKQIFKILDREKTDVVFNSKWLSKLDFKDVIELCSKYTVARMLEREDFKNRFTNNQSISIHEFFYPLMQAYDSVALKADIEIGGTDQRFNILMGRTIQKDYGQESQIALFMPILEGTDGKEKMSKSLGNYIGINEDPNVMFSKVMQIPDNQIIKYYELTTDLHPDHILGIKTDLCNGTNPRDVKVELAKEITKLYHGSEAANKAEEYFKKVFQEKDIPDNIQELKINPELQDKLLDIMLIAKLAPSKSEARRLVTQGAVKINCSRISDFNIKIEDGTILQVGKDKFIKITL